MKKSSNCIFCNIIADKSKAAIIYEDEKVAAFPDISPQAPVHILVVPKEHYATLNDTPGGVAGQCVDAARKIAEEKGIDRAGYRIVINCNDDGGQAVGHLHIHLLGGRKMKWPPG